MKKVFAIAAALMLIGTTAFAQSFGVGYVNSTRTVYSNNPANGFYAGFGYSAEIMPGLSLNPGIYYELLTASSSEDAFGYHLAGSKTTEHYVNVPLHLSYALSFAPTFKLFVYGGPTANIGIASSTVGDLLGAKKTFDNYKNEGISLFDILAGGGIVAEIMKKFRVNVGYDFGLLDRNSSDNVTLKRNRLTAGAAFIF